MQERGRTTTAAPRVTGEGNAALPAVVGVNLIDAAKSEGLLKGLTAPTAQGRVIRLAAGGSADAINDVLFGTALPPGFGGAPDKARGPVKPDKVPAQGPASTVTAPQGGVPAQQRLVESMKAQGFTAQQLSEGAVRLRGRIDNLDVNVIVPRTFEPRPDGKVDVNLHVHGWPRNASVESAVFGRLDFGKMTQGSRGITVIPESPGVNNPALKGWTPYHPTGKGASGYYTSEPFTGFMDKVMTKVAGSGVTQLPEGKPPSSVLGTFSMTGHSGAYEVLGPLLSARGNDPYLSAVKAVGSFDSTYGELHSLAGAATRMRERNGFFMAIGVEGHDTGNNLPTLRDAIRNAPEIERIDRGRHPTITGNIYLGNQLDRGNQDYYNSTQHYDVQREHMPDFFEQLRTRWP